ncbi:hypothetical protein JD844_022944 [Phrynosoma platyrhinos]|uniref:Uncharacterized protein n=1 Tax=Phrynosoma platyrhinos TaxID=52577 RepID=A0ABQ7SW09_PHRPL|nr:hypothetical protein JD844_022944 [Phrynosoma platyrhinos]
MEVDAAHQLSTRTCHIPDETQACSKRGPLEGQIWDLLHEADKTAAENKDQEQVYDAMAETLGDAWDSLVLVLEKRRSLLKLTADFFENALEFAIKIDQVEDFLQNSQEFENPESLRALLKQHEQHTKGTEKTFFFIYFNTYDERDKDSGSG